MKAANENRDIVKGFKAHAELGGFARWGIEVMKLSAEIGRQANLPVYIHFGQLWGLPESGEAGANAAVDPDTILEQVVPLLKPGDILVAPITDPSWTPLFVAASAVVVDVGAPFSHAAIVSRELGIPCVVSATDATGRIPDGATIEVDGTAATVTIVG